MTSHVTQKRQNLGFNVSNVDVVHDEFMFPSYTLLGGRESPMVEPPYQKFFSNMMTYFVM